MKDAFVWIAVACFWLSVAAAVIFGGADDGYFFISLFATAFVAITR